MKDDKQKDDKEVTIRISKKDEEFLGAAGDVLLGVGASAFTWFMLHSWMFSWIGMDDGVCAIIATISFLYFGYSGLEKIVKEM